MGKSTDEEGNNSNVSSPGYDGRPSNNVSLNYAGDRGMEGRKKAYENYAYNQDGGWSHGLLMTCFFF